MPSLVNISLAPVVPRTKCCYVVCYEATTTAEPAPDESYPKTSPRLVRPPVPQAPRRHHLPLVFPLLPPRLFASSGSQNTYVSL